MPRHPAELQTTPPPVRQRAGARQILRLWNWLNSSSGKSLIGGWIAGLFALAFCHQLFARLGGGLLTTGGAAAAVALALVVAAITSRRESQSWSPGAALVPAVWALAVGWLADGLGRVYGQFSLEVLAAPSAQFAAAFAAGLILLGI